MELQCESHKYWGSTETIARGNVLISCMYECVVHVQYLVKVDPGVLEQQVFHVSYSRTTAGLELAATGMTRWVTQCIFFTYSDLSQDSVLGDKLYYHNLIFFEYFYSFPSFHVNILFLENLNSCDYFILVYCFSSSYDWTNGTNSHNDGMHKILNEIYLGSVWKSFYRR